MWETPRYSDRIKAVAAANIYESAEAGDTLNCIGDLCLVEAQELGGEES